MLLLLLLLLTMTTMVLDLQGGFSFLVMPGRAVCGGCESGSGSGGLEMIGVIGFLLDASRWCATVVLGKYTGIWVNLASPFSLAPRICKIKKSESLIFYLLINIKQNLCLLLMI